MEFQIPWEECSDDDKALSFCDLVTEQGEQEFALRDSNTRFLDQEGFGFDFDFRPCGSTTEHVFRADDVFRHGFSFEKSSSENLLVWKNDLVYPQSSFWSISTSLQTETDSGKMIRRSNSKLKGNQKPALTWKNDSLLDSQSSFWSISSSLQRKTHSDEILQLSNSKSKGNRKPGKMSAKWQGLTLGLTKNPSMNLEDMRLKQGKPKSNINGAKNLELRRSVSCNYYKDPKLEDKGAKAVNFEGKCRSRKENVMVKRTAWLKDWKALVKCLSLNNCKTSSNAVVGNGKLQKAPHLR